MSLRIFQQLLLIALIIVSKPSMAAQTIAFHEGDIMVAATPTARAITLSDTSQLWSAGIVPYTVDQTLSSGSIQAIATAISHWNEVGGITLMPLEDARHLSATPIVDFVRFIPGDFCASWVGRQGGQQDVWIAPFCPAGSVMHEIGHLLGLEHEHTRPDRDQYIEIHWDNIQPGKRHNFDVAPAGSRMPGAYDYDSIMHYGSHNFSSNGSATISPIGDEKRNIGQRITPSEGDLQAITELYGSDLSVSSRFASTALGTEIDIYVSNESSRGAHDVSVAVDLIQNLTATTAVSETWTCTNDEDSKLICYLPRLPASAIEHLTIRLPDDPELSSIGILLTSKTPDLDLSNNTSRVQGDEAQEIPAPTPVSAQPVAINDKAQLNDDAVAHVALSGGAVSAHGLLLLLLLLVRQTRSRVYLGLALRIFAVHWRYLRCR